MQKIHTLSKYAVLNIQSSWFWQHLVNMWPQSLIVTLCLYYFWIKNVSMYAHFTSVVIQLHVLHFQKLILLSRLCLLWQCRSQIMWLLSVKSQSRLLSDLRACINRLELRWSEFTRPFKVEPSSMHFQCWTALAQCKLWMGRIWTQFKLGCRWCNRI